MGYFSGVNLEATIETGKNSDDEEINVQIDAGAPFSCFVYKTSIDQFSGKMSFIKVISGTVKADLDAYNPRARERQRIGKVFRALGKKLDDVAVLLPGYTRKRKKVTRAIKQKPA